MKQLFKIGDIVGLKSDSPDMTVVDDKLGDNLGLEKFFDGNYECSWFVKEKEFRKKFPQDSLEKRE